MSHPSFTGIRDLSLSFGEKVIFRNENILVDSGEKVCLTGPSGVGKTSFLNLVMGFELPQKGEVLVLGEVVSAMNIRSLRQKIAWLPQEISVRAATGRDLLMQPFQFKANRRTGPDESVIRDLIAELLLEPGLLEQPTETLSGGQKQRLALASCILLKKPLLLFDEPTSALDDDAVEAVASLAGRQDGVTMISVSHDERWFRSMDRVISLNGNGNGTRT